MSNQTVLNSASDISLRNHGVIEAHAGTGKTYTIVKLVLRILEQTVSGAKEKPVNIHIRDILLVTFTEKAAGELKKRIREGIETRIAELRPEIFAEAGLRTHLENCLNNLHEALIGTIHGICLRLLRTRPFETGVHFQTEIVNDDDGLQSALRESMRTDWQNADTTIPWALEYLIEKGGKLEEKHYTLVCKTAQELLDTENTILDRGSAEISLNTIKNTVTEALSDSDELKNRLRVLINAAHEIINNPAGLDEKRQAFIKELVNDWERSLDKPVISPESVLQASWVKTNCRYKFKPELVQSKLTNQTIIKKNPLVKPFADLFNDFALDKRWASILEQPNTENKLLKTLICDAAELLRTRWNRTKQENGFISFQDMLRLMHKAVHHNPSFCTALREKLRFGIIDEFQDTSILQWQIFKRIFLDSPDVAGSKLFIVGDPKQSIYSIMGADVQSYLDARGAIEQNGGRIYSLVENYRSLPQTIAGYNAILGRSKDEKGVDGDDWFGFDTTAQGDSWIAYPSVNNNDQNDSCGALARPPDKRTSLPEIPLKHDPIQIMILEGSAPRRKSAMAQRAGAAIQSLVGTTLSIPDGLGWKNITLNYSDFAVIAESHSLAEIFLERFQTTGIPAVKYKMAGVFQSPMVRDLHAVLRAILYREGDPAKRLAALLTRFFNISPDRIDPEHDLEPCGASDCNDGKPCLAHALHEWTQLADKRLWAQLFKRIQERTGIRERLIKLTEGDRSLADLRQAIDYCVEKLYRGNFGLLQLVEHLGSLLKGEDEAPQDQNLHVLATEKSSVRVLTMHAAKGLEFPVVFVATGGSKRAFGGPSTLSWIDRDHKKHIMPYFNVDETRVSDPGTQSPHDKMVEQAARERRRLLYVALTRAQSMLFIPVHLQEKGRNENGTVNWSLSALPSHPDNDLTPRLCDLLDRTNPVLIPSEAHWQPMQSAVKPALSGTAAPSILTDIPDLVTLKLAEKICRQTSYSQLSRKVATDRTVDRSDESDSLNDAMAAIPPKVRPALPGGRKTGDALHLVIETLLRAEHISESISDLSSLTALVTSYLTNNGILRGIKDPEAAVTFAVNAITGALNTPLQLPGGGTVSIAGLGRSNRMPEMEFLLGTSPGWVHGFMDLVFRIPEKTASHPWRYFVLDWKSDQLELFDAVSVEACIEDRHYSLQAKIYCHAMEQFLKGILGSTYCAEQNLGGAVYVFLRGFSKEIISTKALVTTWSRKADPKKDAQFLQDLLHN